MNHQRYQQDKAFFTKMPIIAHRGVTSAATENSLAAFRLAAALPNGACAGVELDIHTTADGEFVVHHDPELADGRFICELSTDEVLAVKLADGSSIPMLGEVFEVMGDRMLHVELKGVAADHLPRLAAEFGRRSNCHFHSFDHRLIAALAATDPGLRLGVLSSSYPVDPVRQVQAAGAGTLWQHWRMIDRSLIEGCAASGIGVIAWTAPKSFSMNGLAGLCRDI